jgi:hypothetical protein
VLKAGVFLDEEDDSLFLSNPLSKPMPVAFFKPEAIDLTFDGAPMETLELAPKTLVKLKVQGGNITVSKLAEGAVSPRPFLDPGVLSPTNWWNFQTDLKQGQKGFGYKQMKALYATELQRIQTLLA